jgi:hypothetical protein
MLEVVSTLDYLIYLKIQVIGLDTVVKKKSIKQKYAVYTKIENRHLRAAVIQARKTKALEADFTVLKAIALKKGFKIVIILNTKLKISSVLHIQNNIYNITFAGFVSLYKIYIIRKPFIYITKYVLLNYVLKSLNLLFYIKFMNVAYFNFTLLKSSTIDINRIRKKHTYTTKFYFSFYTRNLYSTSSSIHKVL